MSIDAVDLASRLVAIPSESSQSNMPVIEELSRELEQHGFRLKQYDQKVFDEGTGPKANLVAERGSGKRRVVFSGHVDTVPVGDRGEWDFDPFGGDGIVDGRLYGRGSVDMKGQVAVMAAACSEVDDVLDDLTLVLAITADEETGHQGVKSLTSEHVFERTVGAVVCEPTGMDVIHAHKGAQSLEIDVHGVSCHSSQPDLGVNAIDQARRLLHAIEERTADWRAFRLPEFHDESPTYSVVLIEGGVAHNVVPPLCRVTINARSLIWENHETFRTSVQQIIDDLREEDAAAGIAEDRRFSAEFRLPIIAPPMLTPVDAPWHRMAMQLREQTVPKFVRYGTDGGVLSMVGLPCVVMGPGDIARAHKPNEYITVEEVNEAVQIYADLIRLTAASDLPTVDTTLWDGPIRPY